MINTIINKIMTY